MASNQTYTSSLKVFHSEHRWTISNWIEFQQNEELLRNQSFQFEISNSNSLNSKWKVGLGIQSSYGKLMIQPYLQLHKLEAPYNQLDTTFGTLLFQNDTPMERSYYRVEKKLCVGDILWRTSDMWLFRHPSPKDQFKTSWDGTVTLLISVSAGLQTSPVGDCSDESSKLTLRNMVTLLNDNSLADLKIITCDQKELFAHKCIIKAQNCVFASMFRSEFSEKSISTIRINDITEKTMKILLHYFYTGKVLPDWEDEDTILEFTYAAKQYKLTHVLEMLDQVLGQRDTVVVSFVDVQLLNLAYGMSLKNAESVLFKRVIKGIINVKSAAELFLIFNYQNIVDVPSSEKEIAEVLVVLNSILFIEDSSKFSPTQFRLLALAKKFRLDNVESKLLVRLKKTVEDLKSSAELFTLFDFIQLQHH